MQNLTITSSLWDTKFGLKGKYLLNEKQPSAFNDIYLLVAAAFKQGWWTLGGWRGGELVACNLHHGGKVPHISDKEFPSLLMKITVFTFSHYSNCVQIMWSYRRHRAFIFFGMFESKCPHKSKSCFPPSLIA